jgi:hypothetical protein
MLTNAAELMAEQREWTAEPLRKSEYGVERWLDELTETLKSPTHRPDPVRRVYIPKPDGKQRPLGVPKIRMLPHPARG